jgi:NAD/NADP transhydrogenase alpha subunit
MAAFITQYREPAGRFTINVDKITKYERQGNSFTTVDLDNGTQELVKEAPEQIDVLIGTAQTPGRAV